MLTIRKEQMATFEAEMRERFLQRMVQHTNIHFARVAQELGRVGTRQAVEASWEVAKEHQFVTEYGVCQFINIVFTFGAAFVGAAWAAPILAEPNDPSERARADRLHAAALKVLEGHR